LYLTGNTHENSWRNKGQKADFYLLKGISANILQLLGASLPVFKPLQHAKFESGLEGNTGKQNVLQLGIVSKKMLNRFDIKQPVMFAVFNWEIVIEQKDADKTIFREIPKFPSVQRDLAIVVPRQLPYETVEQTVKKIKLDKLRDIRLFDIFESEKIGEDKKSMAISFTFSDEEKTLTDKEIDSFMTRIINTFEKDLEADVRK